MENKGETTMENKMSISEIQAAVHECARKHGWWDVWDKEGKPARGRDPLSLLMLVVTELAEAAEEFRAPNSDVRALYYVENGEKHLCIAADFPADKKPEGFGVELADAMIRIMDMAGANGIPLEDFILLKMRYNETRAYRHGGKNA